MYAISVIIDVVPDKVEEFKAASLAHANNSRTNEAGCLGFSVFQSVSRPDRFYFHEVYVNRAAVEEVHNTAAYFAAYQEKTRDWALAKDVQFWENEDTPA